MAGRESTRPWRLWALALLWLPGVGLGVVTVTLSLPAGLLGPFAIAVCAVAIRLPAWGAWRWLARRG